MGNALVIGSTLMNNQEKNLSSEPGDPVEECHEQGIRNLLIQDWVYSLQHIVNGTV